MKGDKTAAFALEALKDLPSRKSLGQHVYENLRRAIVRGDISPGYHVVESNVADSLGISRTPVREAIHKLEQEGLLMKLPSRGFAVRDLKQEEIEEIFGIRAVLESYAAGLAALRHREEDLLVLGEKVTEFQRKLDRNEMGGLFRINTEFHDLFYGLSGSPKLITTIDDLRGHIYRFRKILLQRKKTASISNRDHIQMLHAMRSRDKSRVERLVRAHILRGQRELIEALKERWETAEGDPS